MDEAAELDDMNEIETNADRDAETLLGQEAIDEIMVSGCLLLMRSRWWRTRQVVDEVIER